MSDRNELYIRQLYRNLATSGVVLNPKNAREGSFQYSNGSEVVSGTYCIDKENSVVSLTSRIGLADELDLFALLVSFQSFYSTNRAAQPLLKKIGEFSWEISASALLPIRQTQSSIQKFLDKIFEDIIELKKLYLSTKKELEADIRSGAFIDQYIDVVKA